MKFTPIVLAATLMSGAVSAADLSAVPSGTYQVDPTHAYIRFQYNHLGLSNPTLGFEEFSLSINLDNENPQNTTVSLDIVTDSVQTGSAIWHDHITGGKWFDAANNPNITFNSTSVTTNDSGTYNVTGDLTIKGETHPVTLEVTVNGAMMHPMANKPVVGITAYGGLKRSQWGLGANAPYISDEVKLEVQAELLQGS
ncbi:MAG: YceI family protein [Pseudomonadota bacterium]